MASNIIQLKRFNTSQTAYLLIEGAGINGTYSLKGSVAVRQDGTVYVSVKGSTAVTNLATQNNATVDFIAKARLKRDNHVVRQKTINRSEAPSLWSQGGVPIGSAVMPFTKASACYQYSLVVEGGYIYRTSSGDFTPAPPTTQAEIIVTGF